MHQGGFCVESRKANLQVWHLISSRVVAGALDSPRSSFVVQREGGVVSLRYFPILLITKKKSISIPARPQQTAAGNTRDTIATTTGATSSALFSYVFFYIPFSLVWVNRCRRSATASFFAPFVCYYSISSSHYQFSLCVVIIVVFLSYTYILFFSPKSFLPLLYTPLLLLAR